MSEDKNYIIDPLTTICKLAVLYFLPEGTKLGIGYHVITFQDNTCLQWVKRKYNRDERKNIAKLIVPLIKVIQWYLVDGNDKVKIDDDVKISIKCIVQFAIKGLHKIQSDLYMSDISLFVILQHLIDLLDDASHGIFKEDKYKKINSDKGVVTDKIKTNFDGYIISSISKMLTDANNMLNDDLLKKDMMALIQCVKQILTNRDEDFVKMMKELNTIL